MKEKFLSEYTIVNMNNKSLAVESKKSRQRCFIHRNAFNQLENAVDFREVKKTWVCGVIEREIPWIEVLVWKTM